MDIKTEASEERHTDKLRTEAKCRLIELQLSTRLSGYRCLIYGIQLHHDNPEQSVTKQLYPEIGQMFTPKLTGAQVEKLIRYAIDDAWHRRDQEIWKKYFPQEKKPTNWEFISRVSELMDLKQGNEK